MMTVRQRESREVSRVPPPAPLVARCSTRTAPSPQVTLLADGSVVWGGAVGGPGTGRPTLRRRAAEDQEPFARGALPRPSLSGGRWTLNGETLEIIRTTPLGLVSGRDYYMSNALAEVPTHCCRWRSRLGASLEPSRSRPRR